MRLHISRTFIDNSLEHEEDMLTDAAFYSEEVKRAAYAAPAAIFIAGAFRASLILYPHNN